MELLHTMFRQELRPDSFTLSATISACATSGNWQLAVDLLKCMDDWRIPANGICLTAAISACRSSAQWQLACDLLQRVALHDFVFDELACTASMGACGQASQWQRATQLLPWLQGYCLQQSEFVFGAAVGACAKGQASAFSATGHEKTPNTCRCPFKKSASLPQHFAAGHGPRRDSDLPGFAAARFSASDAKSPAAALWFRWGRKDTGKPQANARTPLEPILPDAVCGRGPESRPLRPDDPLKPSRPWRPRRSNSLPVQAHKARPTSEAVTLQACRSLPILESCMLRGISCVLGLAGGHPPRPANDRPTKNTLREHLCKLLLVLRSPATSAARLGPGGPRSEFPDSAEAS